MSEFPSNASYQFIKVKRLGDVFCVEPLRRRIDEDELTQFHGELESLIKSESCRKMVLSLGRFDCLYSIVIAKLITLRRILAEYGGSLKL